MRITIEEARYEKENKNERKLLRKRGKGGRKEGRGEFQKGKKKKLGK